MLFRRFFSGLSSVVATAVQEEPVKKPVDEKKHDSFKLKKLATPSVINSKILAAHAAAEQNQNQKVKNQKTDDDSGWTGLIDPKLLGENDTRAAKYATRFKRFASIRSDDFHHKALESGEYSVDDFYMTPRDFLESITRAEPSQNHHSSIETLTQYLNNIDEKQLIKELQVTRKLKLEKRMDLQKSKKNKIDTKDLIDINFLSFFGNKGLLNFYDYLFLHSVISKSHRKLHLAFELLDYDGSGTVDLYEYTSLERFLSHQTEEQDNSNKAQSAANNNSSGFRHYNDVRIPNLLKLYFFGEDGKDELDQARFDHFCKIIQREVLQQEFRLLMQADYQDLIQALKEEDEDDLGDGEFSPRTQIDLHKTTAIEENKDFADPKTKIDSQNDTISGKNFAVAILRNTQLPSAQIEELLEKLLTENPDVKINFLDYMDFFDFLLNVDEVAEILKFIEKNQIDEVKQNQFQFAVQVATGIKMSENVLDVLYAVLDSNEDGKISYKELTSVFRTRLEMSMRSYLEDNKRTFTKCLFHTGYQMRIADTL